MKVAEELIRAVYEIAKAIKGDDGNGGGETSNDNGLYGADGIIVTDGKEQEKSKVFLSQKELFDDFKTNVLQYDNSGNVRDVYFLYTENNIDKLLKPTTGIIGKINEYPDEHFQVRFVDKDGLENYELISIQNYFVQNEIGESNAQKIIEKLGNNVYIFNKKIA